MFITPIIYAEGSVSSMVLFLKKDLTYLYDRLLKFRIKPCNFRTILPTGEIVFKLSISNLVALRTESLAYEWAIQLLEYEK